ncbi:MAG: hypothetical protein ABSG61_04900 [Gemmatimonadales bacterium]|jgi:hypothetical protein
MTSPRSEPGFFARHAAVRRAVALVLAAISTTACMRWQPALNGASYVTAQRPSQVRVTLVGGDQVDVYRPAVVDSQLVGNSGSAEHWAKVAIPLSQVKSIEVPQGAPGRTMALIIPLVLVVAVITSGGFTFGPKGILLR